MCQFKFSIAFYADFVFLTQVPVAVIIKKCLIFVTRTCYVFLYVLVDLL